MVRVCLFTAGKESFHFPCVRYNFKVSIDFKVGAVVEVVVPRASSPSSYALTTVANIRTIFTSAHNSITSYNFRLNIIITYHKEKVKYFQ